MNRIQFVLVVALTAPIYLFGAIYQLAIDAFNGGREDWGRD